MKTVGLFVLLSVIATISVCGCVLIKRYRRIAVEKKKLEKMLEQAIIQSKGLKY